MTSLLNPILQRFAEHFPIPTMARAVLERCLNPAPLDAGFETVAGGQYPRTLLFSTRFQRMRQGVSRPQPSIPAAYPAVPVLIAGSVKSVYNKLNGLEPGPSAALVRYSAEQATALIAEVGGARPGGLAGYRVKIRDGNARAGRAHRLAETRGQTAAPLPGQARVVFDPAWDVIVDLVPRADASTQERALLPTVLERVQPGEGWIADRNFCTRGLRWGRHARGAVGLVREHAQIPFTPLEALRGVGEIENGRVSEQRSVIDAPDGSGTLEVRRIRLDVHQPTRDGDDTLYRRTTVPAAAADACALARLYGERWTLEKAFLHLTRQLRGEIDTWASPPAALFGLAMAGVAYNGLAGVQATLRQVHGAAAIDDGVSADYRVHEMARVTESLETRVEPRDGAVFQTLPLATMAAWRIATAGRVQLRQYRKHPRGPKKPPVKRTHDPRRPQVSVARLLALRQQAV